MYRNLIGASSALAILALLAGAPAPSLADGHSRLCNVIVDGDGDPILESDSDEIAHSNTTECADKGGVENVGGEAEAAVPAPAIESLNVYFDVGQDSLDDDARAEVDSYATALMATSPSSLNVVGYTDTSGPADVNARLSKARATSVAEALVEAGVPADIIEQGGSGEDSLAVDTPDDTAEASNRRVSVTPAY